MKQVLKKLFKPLPLVIICFISISLVVIATAPPSFFVLPLGFCRESPVGLDLSMGQIVEYEVVDYGRRGNVWTLRSDLGGPWDYLKIKLGFENIDKVCLKLK